jgi:hypothetical protein
MKERVVMEQAEKVEKEATDKVVEEEIQKKNAEERRDDTCPMEVDIPRTYVEDIETYLTGNNLGLGF